MTKYSGPNRGVRNGYTARFFRVGNLVSIGKPNDLDVSFQALADVENISPFVAKFIQTKPDEVDAGELRVRHDRANGGDIFVLGISAGYGLPIIGSGARERTAEVIRRLSPRYEVATDANPPSSGSKERR